jgi:hypothetical protein
MSAVKLIAVAALFAGFISSTMAENRTPTELAETIAPDYRAVDVSASNGAKFVWVQRIEGRDSAGNTRLLFSDLQGALLPLQQLHQADHLINPQEVRNKGTYSELQLTLASNMLTVSGNGMKRTPMPQGMQRNVVLEGDLEISKFDVSSSGLKLQGKKLEQLAMLAH